MLRLSKMADYAGVIVVHMARFTEQNHTAASLSEQLHLPKATVAKCLKTLAKHQVLVSLRGVHGGYRLARPANEIAVAEVIDALEGPVQITACVHGQKTDCQIHQTCPMRGGWDSINTTIRQSLERTSVADMARSVPANMGGQAV